MVPPSTHPTFPTMVSPVYQKLTVRRGCARRRIDERPWHSGPLFFLPQTAAAHTARQRGRTTRFVMFLHLNCSCLHGVNTTQGGVETDVSFAEKRKKIVSRLEKNVRCKHGNKMMTPPLPLQSSLLLMMADTVITI